MKNIQVDIIDKLTPELIEEMKHIYFTADLHFDHPKIVRICNRPVPLTENLDISIPEQKETHERTTQRLACKRSL